MDGGGSRDVNGQLEKKQNRRAEFYDCVEWTRIVDTAADELSPRPIGMLSLSANFPQFFSFFLSFLSSFFYLTSPFLFLSVKSNGNNQRKIKDSKKMCY